MPVAKYLFERPYLLHALLGGTSGAAIAGGTAGMTAPKGKKNKRALKAALQGAAVGTSLGLATPALARHVLAPAVKRLVERGRPHEAGLLLSAGALPVLLTGAGAGVIGAGHGLGSHLQSERQRRSHAERQLSKKSSAIIDTFAKSAGAPFLEQDRPEKVKEIYKALKRDHPDMPAEMKARIAARQGKKGKQKQGPPYKAPITPWKEEGEKKATAPIDLLDKDRPDVKLFLLGAENLKKKVELAERQGKEKKSHEERAYAVVARVSHDPEVVLASFNEEMEKISAIPGMGLFSRGALRGAQWLTGGARALEEGVIRPGSFRAIASGLGERTGLTGLLSRVGAGAPEAVAARQAAAGGRLRQLVGQDQLRAIEGQGLGRGTATTIERGVPLAQRVPGPVATPRPVAPTAAPTAAPTGAAAPSVVPSAPVQAAGAAPGGVASINPAANQMTPVGRLPPGMESLPEGTIPVRTPANIVGEPKAPFLDRLLQGAENVAGRAGTVAGRGANLAEAGSKTIAENVAKLEAAGTSAAESVGKITSLPTRMHRQYLTQKGIARGLSPEEAGAAATKQLEERAARRAAPKAEAVAKTEGAPTGTPEPTVPEPANTPFTQNLFKRMGVDVNPEQANRLALALGLGGAGALGAGALGGAMLSGRGGGTTVVAR